MDRKLRKIIANPLRRGTEASMQSFRPGWLPNDVWLAPVPEMVDETVSK